MTQRSKFQSTCPMWGATYHYYPLEACSIFQSTCPMWGATAAGYNHLANEEYISIHVPHVGRDKLPRIRDRRPRHFNPRAPCGARPELPDEGNVPFYFNPRAPCGARLRETLTLTQRDIISIHVPHVGRDSDGKRKMIVFRCISIHVPHVGRDTAVLLTIPA